MIKNNMTTCEEDDVRQRSGCHGWGAVAMYQCPTEVAGLQPLEPGWTKLLWTPKTKLVDSIDMRVTLGRDNVGFVRWDRQKGSMVRLELDIPAHIVTRSQDGHDVEH